MSCTCTNEARHELPSGVLLAPVETAIDCPSHGAVSRIHRLPVLADTLSAAAAGERQLSADELLSAADALRLLSGMIAA